MIFNSKEQAMKYMKEHSYMVTDTVDFGTFFEVTILNRDMNKCKVVCKKIKKRRNKDENE